MKSPIELRALVEVPEAAPFGFDEFERRSAAQRHRVRTLGWSTAAVVGVLALVPVLAVLTQSPGPAATVVSVSTATASPAELFQQPALVDMDRFAITSELEDHIALLDAEISQAQLRPVPTAELRQMETARRQLNDSLQRVSYAHSLLDL